MAGPQGDGSNYRRLQQSHPCFGQGSQGNLGRIHLPVSPGCNICCRFCDRTVSDTAQRPGVTGTVIKPEDSIRVLEKAMEVCPYITVAGIAGPGDTLASDNALETFRYVDREYPELIKCMSTNGLLLAERAEEVIEAGIDSLTVTVNAVDPEIEAKLNKYILYHGQKIEGVVAAKILIYNQIEGIRRVAASGTTVVKVNTVLVPGINDQHIETVAKTVAEAGASIYNIIPLIPQYELKDIPEPTCEQIDAARTAAGKYIDVFRHCARCRADAVGVPGREDRHGDVYGRISVKERFSHG